MKDFRRQVVGGYSSKDVDDFLMNLAVDIDRRDRHAEAVRVTMEQTNQVSGQQTEDDARDPANGEPADHKALADGEAIVEEAQQLALEIVAKAKATAKKGLLLSRERAEEILQDARERQQQAARLEAEAQLRLAHVEQRLSDQAEAISAEARRLDHLAGWIEGLDLLTEVPKPLNGEDVGDKGDAVTSGPDAASSGNGEIVHLKPTAD